VPDPTPAPGRGAKKTSQKREVVGGYLLPAPRPSPTARTMAVERPDETSEASAAPKATRGDAKGKTRVDPAAAPRTLSVPKNLEGARLDKALVVLAGVSRSGAKQLLETGVRVNGRRAVKGAVVHEGDTISIEGASEAQGDLAAVADPDVVLDVRLENEQLVVVHKPPRLATAPLKAGERGTLANGVVARYPETAKVGSDPREPGLVHRLDTDTSGLVLVARSREAFDELKDALRDGRVDKRYLVIVATSGKSGRAASVAATGELADHGTIDIPLAPHPKDKRRVFACVHERDVHRLAPRDATTQYKVLRRWTTPDGGRALIEARASKALRHQVRVHFAALGAPLVGDGLYGGPPAPSLGRHALHASRVAYEGGAHVKGFVVDAPLPEDMQRLVSESPAHDEGDQ
jgi:23S rRNA pseudouridine1911/1915/1917 synthase